MSAGLRFDACSTGNGKSDDPAEGLVFTQDGLDEVSTDRLHDLLRRIDPEMAEELHPNNRRKIIRSVSFSLAFALAAALAHALALAL